MAKKNARNTRGKIVNAAWKLFYEQGYEDTTVEEIIDLSGTSKGSFYHYYLGKKNKWLVCLPPILSNTIIVPWVLRYAYGSTDLIPYAMLTVGIGEILAIGVLGNLLLLALERNHRAVFTQ